MMRRATLVVAAGLLLSLPGQAFGKQIVLTPPGKSGADQYFETIPTSAGNAAPPSGGGTTGGGTSAIAGLGHGRAGDARLSRLGKAGAAAAVLAAVTAPNNAASGGSHHNGNGSGAGSAGAAGLGNSVSQPAGQSASSALANALTGTDDGGLGFVLPVLLAATLIAAIGLAIVRMRRRTDPPDVTA